MENTSKNSKHIQSKTTSQVKNDVQSKTASQVKNDVQSKTASQVRADVRSKTQYQEQSNVQQKTLNVGLLAHVDAGKTTLAESLLYLGGRIRKLGRVDNKDAFFDHYELERERGITIFSKQARILIGDLTLTLLDTPGHVDFSAEMERTLQVLDYAVLIISGADGVQSHTRTLWQLLGRYKIPTFIFINKMDRSGVNREVLLADIHKNLGENCLDFQDDEENLREALAMCDELALNDYLETGEISIDRIRQLIAKRKAFPCYFGSALKLTGVEEFLEALCLYMRVPKYGQNFGARVYKISRDTQGNRLTWLKMTGGSLRVRELVKGKDKENGKEEKISQIRIYNGEKYETTESVAGGTICAVTGLNDTKAGDGLGIEAEQVVPVLEPVLTYRIELPKDQDVHRALLQLRQLEEEVPELHVVWEELSGEILVQLMGEIQTEVLVQLIWERFGMAVSFGEGQIIYKETIESAVEGVGHFEPLRHYAEVHLLMEPSEVGSGLHFASMCSENQLDRNWQRLILTHLEERIHVGVLMGSPITDMRITLVSGRAHLKHTEGGDFRQATYRALRQGLMKAKSVLLEPWYQFRLEIPHSQVGRAMTDIEKMGGSASLAEGTGEFSVLSGRAPVASMGGYQKQIAAYTGGNGRLFCTLEGYYPCHNTEEVLSQKAYDAERDTKNPSGSVFCAHGAGYVVPWYEVEEHMHLEGLGLEKQEETASVRTAVQKTTEKIPSTGRGMSLAEDKELEAIFVRTYGEIRHREQGHSRVIRAENEKLNTERGKSVRSQENRDAKDHENSKREKTEHSEETRNERENNNKKSKKRGANTTQYLLIDGYNIIFAWEDLRKLSEKSMEAARSRLMHILSNYQGYTGIKVILVFDAYRVADFPGELFEWHNLRVVFTKTAETADQYIEKTAHEIGHQYRVTVATSDGMEQVIIRSQGCLLLSASELYGEVERINREIREDFLHQKNTRGNYLLNYLSEEDAIKMEKLRLGKTDEKRKTRG